MTKYFIILSILLISSCSAKEKSSPLFKVGDCTVTKNEMDKHEFIKSNIAIRKIKEVGRRNYLYEFMYRGVLVETSFSSYEIDEVKIECPEYWK